MHNTHNTTCDTQLIIQHAHGTVHNMNYTLHNAQ